jgi:hypothetical protein
MSESQNAEKKGPQMTLAVEAPIGPYEIPLALGVRGR